MKKSILSIFSTIFSFILILSMFSGCFWEIIGPPNLKLDAFSQESPLYTNGTILGKTIEYYTDSPSDIYFKIDINAPDYSLSEVNIQFKNTAKEFSLNEELTKLANADKFENVLTEKGNLGEIYLVFTDESMGDIVSQWNYAKYLMITKQKTMDSETYTSVKYHVWIDMDVTTIEGSAPWMSETPEV